MNLYTYGHNNPILNTDPSGHIAPLVAAAIILSASAISMWGSNIKQSKEKGGLANVNVSETASVGLATAGGTMAAIATGGAMAAMAPAATSTLGGTIAIGASSSLAGGIATRTSYNLAYNLNTPISNQLDYVLDPRAQAFDMLVGGLTGAAFYGLNNIDFNRTLRGSVSLGRSANKLYPDPNAVGPHSTFKMDPNTGKITKYVTWEPNPRNPIGFDPIKRYDGLGDWHFNKAIQNRVYTPHIHEKITPGGVRTAEPWEIP